MAKTYKLGVSIGLKVGTFCQVPRCVRENVIKKRIRKGRGGSRRRIYSSRLMPIVGRRKKPQMNNDFGERDGGTLGF